MAFGKPPHARHVFFSDGVELIKLEKGRATETQPGCGPNDVDVAVTWSLPRYAVSASLMYTEAVVAFEHIYSQKLSFRPREQTLVVAAQLTRHLSE